MMIQSALPPDWMGCSFSDHTLFYFAAPPLYMVRVHFSEWNGLEVVPQNRKRAKVVPKAAPRCAPNRAAKVDARIAKCNGVAKVALEAVESSGGQKDAPHCPRYSPMPRRCQEEFRIGHYHCWRCEESSNDVDHNREVSKAIWRVYCWRTSRPCSLLRGEG